MLLHVVVRGGGHGDGGEHAEASMHLDGLGKVHLSTLFGPHLDQIVLNTAMSPMAPSDDDASQAQLFSLALGVGSEGRALASRTRVLPYFCSDDAITKLMTHAITHHSPPALISALLHALALGIEAPWMASLRGQASQVLLVGFNGLGSSMDGLIIQVLHNEWATREPVKESFRSIVVEQLKVGAEVNSRHDGW